MLFSRNFVYARFTWACVGVWITALEQIFSVSMENILEIGERIFYAEKRDGEKCGKRKFESAFYVIWYVAVGERDVKQWAKEKENKIEGEYNRCI